MTQRTLCVFRVGTGAGGGACVRLSSCMPACMCVSLWQDGAMIAPNYWLLLPFGEFSLSKCLAGWEIRWKGMSTWLTTRVEDTWGQMDGETGLEKPDLWPDVSRQIDACVCVRVHVYKHPPAEMAVDGCHSDTNLPSVRWQGMHRWSSPAYLVTNCPERLPTLLRVNHSGSLFSNCVHDCSLHSLFE